MIKIGGNFLFDCLAEEPESLFQTPTPLLFQNFGIRVRQFFKFEYSTLVQTPATINNPILIE